MAYTRKNLWAELKALGVEKWDWPGEGARQVVPGARNDFDMIVEYCWVAYGKANSASGPLVIGRVGDLKAAGLYGKVADIVGDQTLFDQGTAGNLLQMDRWARVMNDAWILGGVHRQALFRLASPRIMDNLWNRDGSYFIVTAREVLGLLHFGYAFEQVGPWQCLVSRSPARATTADLVKYDQVIKRGQTLAQARALEDKVGSSSRAAAQVRAFQRR